MLLYTHIIDTMLVSSFVARNTRFNSTYLVLISLFTINYTSKYHHATSTFNRVPIALWPLWMADKYYHSMIKIPLPVKSCVSLVLQSTGPLKINLHMLYNLRNTMCKTSTYPPNVFNGFVLSFKT